MSDEEVASTRAESLLSFVSGEAGAEEEEEEAEGREGMERSTSGVPNETMSSATLFFFNFLPSCAAVVKVSGLSLTSQASETNFDQRSLALLDGAANKHDDPLPLVLVLAMLERELYRRRDPYQPLTPAQSPGSRTRNESRT